MSKWIDIEDKTINIDRIDYFEWSEIHESNMSEFVLLKIWFGNSNYVPIVVKKLAKERINSNIKSR